MKVISGKYKGRNLKGYNIEGTRPTMDRVKESLFASIQDYIKDSIVLDLFSGSGSLGIEALSNGAKYCYFCDNNKMMINIIKDNLNTLNITNYRIYNNDYMNTLETLVNTRIKLDIIFLDPPYNLTILNNIVDYINTNNLLNNNGLVVIEHQKNYISKDYNNLELLKSKKYSDKYISILSRKKE